MAWQTPITNWGIGGQTTPGLDDFNRIEGNTLDLHQFRLHEQGTVTYGPSGLPDILPPDAPMNVLIYANNHEMMIYRPSPGAIRYHIISVIPGPGGPSSKLVLKFDFTSPPYILYPYDTLFLRIDNTSGTPRIYAHLSRGQESGTFTPTLRFGGSTAGIAYNGRYGYYTRVGNLVTFHVHIALSSKGSATGDVNVSFPFPAAENIDAQKIICGTFTHPEGQGLVQLVLYAGYSSGFLSKVTSSNEIIPMTDSDVNNTSEFYLSGSYFCE